MTTDPIRRMVVDEATSLRTERDGATFYFAATIVGNRSCPRHRERRTTNRPRKPRSVCLPQVLGLPG